MAVEWIRPGRVSPCLGFTVTSNESQRRNLLPDCSSYFTYKVKERDASVSSVSSVSEEV